MNIVINESASDALNRYPCRIRTGEGRYEAISQGQEITFKVGKTLRKFTVIVSNCWSAFGAYMPEYNGICIFDDDNGLVVLDRHLQQTTGYHGPNAKQVDEYERIVKMSWSDFKALINNNSRSRINLDSRNQIIYR